MASFSDDFVCIPRALADMFLELNQVPLNRPPIVSAEALNGQVGTRRSCESIPAKEISFEKSQKSPRFFMTSSYEATR